MAKRRSDAEHREQMRIGDQLLRNFLIVFVLTFAAEIALRAFPSFLETVPERQWLEWLLVSLLGVCAYLLWNIASWYRKSAVDFKAFRPWYRATAARGPIIALVVLIALTNISFQVQVPTTQEETTEAVAVEADAETEPETPAPFSFGIDFQSASESVLLLTAFLIGFFSRLAKTLLEEIARFIFGDLFEKTYSGERSLGNGYADNGSAGDGG
jgi:hypothetical protein